MFSDRLCNVRKTTPLVHNITNYVTINDVANAVLACGGSPIMADEPEDVEDITTICGGLNINIGNLNSQTIEAMRIAGRRSRELGHARVLDPVAAGASELRTRIASELVDTVGFDAIRGNVSELKALALGSATTRGVDASAADAMTDAWLDEMVSFSKGYAREVEGIVAITGAIDLVTDEETCYVIRNGRAEMGRVTGTGCMLSGVLCAYLIANPKDKLEAAAAAVCLMGLAGEVGWSRMQEGDGNATYRNRIIDAIYNIDGEQLDREARYELR